MRTKEIVEEAQRVSIDTLTVALKARASQSKEVHSGRSLGAGARPGASAAEMVTVETRAAQSARDQAGMSPDRGFAGRSGARPTRTARSPTSNPIATQPSVSIPNKAPNARASGAPIARHQRTRYLSDATRVATPTNPPIHPAREGAGHHGHAQGARQRQAHRGGTAGPGPANA